MTTKDQISALLENSELNNQGGFPELWLEKKINTTEIDKAYNLAKENISENEFKKIIRTIAKKKQHWNDLFQDNKIENFNYSFQPAEIKKLYILNEDAKKVYVAYSDKKAKEYLSSKNTKEITKIELGEIKKSNERDNLIETYNFVVTGTMPKQDQETNKEYRGLEKYYLGSFEGSKKKAQTEIQKRHANLLSSNDYGFIADNFILLDKNEKTIDITFDVSPHNKNPQWQSDKYLQDTLIIKNKISALLTHASWESGMRDNYETARRLREQADELETLHLGEKNNYLHRNVSELDLSLYNNRSAMATYDINKSIDEHANIAKSLNKIDSTLAYDNIQNERKQSIGREKEDEYDKSGNVIMQEYYNEKEDKFKQIFYDVENLVSAENKSKKTLSKEQMPSDKSVIKLYENFKNEQNEYNYYRSNENEYDQLDTPRTTILIKCDKQHLINIIDSVKIATSLEESQLGTHKDAVYNTDSKEYNSYLTKRYEVEQTISMVSNVYNVSGYYVLTSNKKEKITENILKSYAKNNNISVAISEKEDRFATYEKNLDRKYGNCDQKTPRELNQRYDKAISILLEIAKQSHSLDLSKKTHEQVEILEKYSYSTPASANKEKEISTLNNNYDSMMSIKQEQFKKAQLENQRQYDIINTERKTKEQNNELEQPF